MGRGGRSWVACVAILLAGAGVVAHAQEESEEKKYGWFNATDLSIVVTDGNSSVETFGFKNTLRWAQENANFRLKLDALRSDTADDWFLLVDPGLTWLPGEDPPQASSFTLIKPPTEPDVERYFLEGRYDRTLTEKLFWNAGASWDRNEDADILNRYIAFGGLGHRWKDGDKMKYTSSYGLSFTDREEDQPDPEKEDSFAGVRWGWDFFWKLGKVTEYDNDFTANFSLADSSDYNFDMTNAISVNMSSHLALKVSLQWLYANEPALTEVDVLARVIIVDPDGIPGSGDEFFETVGLGEGGEIEIGEADVRKEDLDTIFRTSLVIKF